MEFRRNHLEGATGPQCQEQDLGDESQNSQAVIRVMVEICFLQEYTSVMRYFVPGFLSHSPFRS